MMALRYGRSAFRSGRSGLRQSKNNALRSLSSKPQIIYTETDEAPMLATYSFLPIVRKLVSMAGIDVTKSDISLSGRILAHFPDRLSPEQQV
jgi:monomeric isocitrate dehydrogenase